MTRMVVAAGRLARAWRALLGFDCRLGDTGAADGVSGMRLPAEEDWVGGLGLV
jgi:hypothetical protein